jgi:glycosyltransferase involved in cell wall biosynthesis
MNLWLLPGRRRKSARYWQKCDMRVLHLVKTSTGANWALRQVRELAKAGLEIHVALPSGGPLVGAYEAAGAIEHHLQTGFPIRKLWRVPKTFRDFRRLVENVKPDIIHSHFVSNTLTMRLALDKTDRTPRLFQVPGPLHLEHPFFRWAEISTAGPNDCWIGSCKWTCQRYIASGIPEDRIFLSYYGTDVVGYTANPKGYLRKELNLSDQTKIVGMVAFMYGPKRYMGQTRGLKGHEDLIDAISICLESEPDMFCVIVGGAWMGAERYENRLMEYGHKHCGDKIIFLGTRRDVPLLYPDFNVAVHPSHSENVGGAVESLLSGVPTITTDVGGFPDLVIENETGWNVPPRSPSELARTIIGAIRNGDKTKLLTQKGQFLAKTMFDVRRTAGEVKQIYNIVLNHH